MLRRSPNEHVYKWLELFLCSGTDTRDPVLTKQLTQAINRKDRKMTRLLIDFKSAGTHAQLLTGESCNRTARLTLDQAPSAYCYCQF